jgi:hypothetical protein
MSEVPSPRRFVVWAALLLVPVVVATLLIPRLYRSANAPPRPLPAAAEPAPSGPLAAVASGLGALAGAAQAGAIGSDQAPAPTPPTPPRSDGPTAAELEAARAAEEELAKARSGWRKVEFMAPREGKAAARGERVVPFQGFGLSIDSTPSGASVAVDGKVLGLTPLLTSLPCRPGDQIAVEVTLRPNRSGRRQIRCRADELVSVTIPLGR